jgi:hypothetical protein
MDQTSDHCFKEPAHRHPGPYVLVSVLFNSFVEQNTSLFHIFG